MVRLRITVNVLRAPVCVCSPTAPIPDILSGWGAGVCGVVVVVVEVEQSMMVSGGPESASGFPQVICPLWECSLMLHSHRNANKTSEAQT